MHASNDPSRPGWVLAIAAIASFMVALDALVVTTALGSIRDNLGASLEALEWTVNAYNLSFAVLLMTGAALGDRYGRRRMFSAGLALFVAASAACAIAGGIGWLIAARAVQGAGAALVMPLAMALLGVAFPREQRARALGIFGGVTGLAVLGGPLVGGAISEGLAWQWIFWLNLPIGIATIALVPRHIGESYGPRQPLDGSGLLLLAGSAFGLVWGLVRGNSAGWTSLEVAVALGAGLVLGAAFITLERRAAAPMVPLRLFLSPAFAAGNAAGFLFSASLYGTLFFMAQFFQTAQAHGPLGAGLRLLPWTATLFIVAPLTGNLVRRVGERLLVSGGLLLQAVGLAWIALIAGPDIAYLKLVAPLVIAGAGISMAMPAAQNAVIGAVAPTEIGKASGIYNTLRYLGGAVGIALLVAAFSALGGYASPQDFSSGFAPALCVAAALSLAGSLAGLLLPGQPTVAARRLSTFKQGEMS
jgi:EmrB/QacA subfamily drug resistance transporter